MHFFYYLFLLSTNQITKTTKGDGDDNDNYELFLWYN